jgi:hypothetical protein
MVESASSRSQVNRSSQRVGAKFPTLFLNPRREGEDRLRDWIVRRMASTFAIGVVMVSLLAVHVSARTPLLYVEDNKDGTIFVKATLFEGASTGEMPCRLEDKDGNVLWEGEFDQYGTLTVKKPDVDPYFVVFDAGAGHVVKEQGPKLSPWEKRALTTEAQVAAPRAPEGRGQVAPAAPQPTSPWSPGALWAIVGSLSLITLALVLICVGMVIFIGWTMGAKSHGFKHKKEEIE